MDKLKESREARKGYGCGFLLVWAYLMFLSIVLAPAIAMAIKAAFR